MNQWRWQIKDFRVLKLHNIRTLVWAGFALLFFGIFIKMTWELREDPSLALADQNILIAIAKLRHASLNGSAVDMTALGSPTVLALFAVIGVTVLALNRDRRGLVYLAIGSAGAGIHTFALKRLFIRERPSVVPRLIEVSGFSYPSGHSLGATSIYLLLMFLAWRHYTQWPARLILLACTTTVIGGVCASRLYLGVHYPSDVLSGVCMGGAWVFLLTAFFSRPQKNN